MLRAFRVCSSRPAPLPRLPLVALLALGVLLVACSSSQPVVETHTSIVTADDRGVITISRGPSVPIVPVALTSFCDHWASLADRAVEFATAPANTPPNMTTNFDATTAFIWSLAETSPQDARKDFHNYAIIWSSYANRVIDAGYDFTAIPLDEESMDSVRSAGAKVNAWSRANCRAGLTVPTEIQIAMLGAGAPQFPAGSAERVVQEYLKAVTDRNVTAALSALTTELVAPCRDRLREAVSLRESKEVRAALELTTRGETATEVRVRISEFFGESARRPETARSIPFEMRRSGDRWMIAKTSWPDLCPAKGAP